MLHQLLSKQLFPPLFVMTCISFAIGFIIQCVNFRNMFLCILITQFHFYNGDSKVIAEVLQRKWNTVPEKQIVRRFIIKARQWSLS
jgi:hypothetical protein